MRRTCSITVSLFVGEQKSLSRERLQENAAAAPRSSPDLWKKLLHEPKTVPGRIRRCSTLFPDSARVEGGELALGGVPASELADRFGTPLVVYCEETLRRQARALRAAAGPDGRVFYGTKAFPNVALLGLLREEGIGADVASTGELAFARAAGLSGGELVVHGNNKDDSVPARGRGGAAPVVLDAPDEAELAAAAGVERVLVRVTLGVDADTHEAIVTGHHGSKFGLPPDEAQERLADALDAGSTCSAFTSTSARSFPTSRRRRRRFAASPRSPPTVVTRSAGKPASPTSVADSGSATPSTTRCPKRPTSRRRLHARAREAFAAAGLPAPAIWLEPGRSLVGRAGVTLYRVGAVKRLADRTWVAVDGGMSDNPRPQLYDARYTALSAARADEPPDETVSVAGMHCESGDVLIDDVALPAPRRGDLLAVPATGAYTLAMSSNYNGVAGPLPCSCATARPASSAGARPSTTCSRSRAVDSRAFPAGLTR